MNLKKEAVTKRWSRLKQSMKKGETPSGSVYTFLWLCLKHSSRDKVSNNDFTGCKRQADKSR